MRGIFKKLEGQFSPDGKSLYQYGEDLGFKEGDRLVIKPYEEVAKSSIEFPPFQLEAKKIYDWLKEQEVVCIKYPLQTGSIDKTIMNYMTIEVLVKTKKGKERSFITCSYYFTKLEETDNWRNGLNLLKKLH